MKTNLKNRQAKVWNFADDSWAEIEISFLPPLRISISNSSAHVESPIPPRDTNLAALVCIGSSSSQPG